MVWPWTEPVISKLLVIPNSPTDSQFPCKLKHKTLEKLQVGNRIGGNNLDTMVGVIRLKYLRVVNYRSLVTMPFIINLESMSLLRWSNVVFLLSTKQGYQSVKKENYSLITQQPEDNTKKDQNVWASLLKIKKLNQGCLRTYWMWLREV